MSITPIPPDVKAAVIKRDGTRCLCCTVQTTRHLDGRVRPDTIAFDHIVPECSGGPTTVDNLQVLCTECNQRKGSRTTDYRRASPWRGRSFTTRKERREWAAWQREWAAYQEERAAFLATLPPGWDEARQALADRHRTLVR